MRGALIKGGRASHGPAIKLAQGKDALGRAWPVVLDSHVALGTFVLTPELEIPEVGEAHWPARKTRHKGTCVVCLGGTWGTLCPTPVPLSSSEHREKNLGGSTKQGGWERSRSAGCPCSDDLAAKDEGIDHFLRPRETAAPLSGAGRGRVPLKKPTRRLQEDDHAQGQQSHARRLSAPAPGPSTLARCRERAVQLY